MGLERTFWVISSNPLTWLNPQYIPVVFRKVRVEMGCRSCPQKHTMGVRSQFHSLPPSWASPRSWSTDSSSAVSLSATPLWTPYFPHACIFSHDCPQATNYGPNPKSDLSGLLHVIIRTSHTPTKDSTSLRSWTLEQVTKSFYLSLVCSLCLSPTHKLEQWRPP